MVRLKKYGSVVPMLEYARLERAFAKTTGSATVSSWMCLFPFDNFVFRI